MEAARAAGCPDGAIGCISLPTVDAVEELMKHRQVRLILATGGEAMVRAAYSSGKPAIGVGAGNGPAYLHPSCDLARAVADIFRSKTFDNGTICASEQSIIYHRDMESAVLAELQRQGGCVLTEEEAGQLAGHLFRANGTMNPKTVGKTAGELAKLAGLGDRARTAAVLLARETDAGPDNPYSHEKLCPVLALYCVENEEKALGLATGILLHEGSGHTFAIHASDESVIRRFCTRVPVSRFLVNTPAALGGIGSTTGLFPALTLGCGAVGGSSSSNNIGPLDLINIRRVAWDSEAPGPTPSPKQESHPAGVDEALLCAITDRLMKKINDRR